MSKQQHTLEELELVDSHEPSVEVIESVAHPINDHLSLSLEFLYNSIRPKTCVRSNPASISSSRLAISALLHAWFAMESSVNMAIYQQLFNEKSPSYIPPDTRSAYDRKIARDFQRSLSFTDRIDYLRNNKTCCTKVQDNLGKLRQFEKIRNALVHGYVHPKEILLEEQLGTRKKSINEDGDTIIVTEFATREQAISTHRGAPIDVKKDFAELGLNHHYSEICCHDSYKCVWLAVVILNWVDRHFGIIVTARWQRDGTSYKFSSREPKTSLVSGHSTNKSFVGINALIKDINALVVKNHNQVVMKAVVAKKSARRAPRRKK